MPDGTPMVIRLARPSEAGVLRDIYRRSSLHDEGYRQVLLAHPEVLDWSDLALAEKRTWLAEAAGRVVGFVSLLVTGTMVELDDLFVDPDWMRHGVGRALVADAVATARSRGFDRLEVTANRYAIAFYEKVGFTDDFVVETRFGSGTRMHRDLAS